MDDEQKINELANTLFSKGLAASMWDAKNKAKDILGFSSEMIEKSSAEVEGHKNDEMPVQEIMNEAGIDIVDVKKAEEDKIEEISKEFQKSLGKEDSFENVSDGIQEAVQDSVDNSDDLESEHMSTPETSENNEVTQVDEFPEVSKELTEPSIDIDVSANPEGEENIDFQRNEAIPVDETTEVNGVDNSLVIDGTVSQFDLSEISEGADEQNNGEDSDRQEETQKQSEELQTDDYSESNETFENATESFSENNSESEPVQELNDELEEIHIEEGQIMNGDDMANIEEPSPDVISESDSVVDSSETEETNGEQEDNEQQESNVQQESETTDYDDNKGDYVYFGGDSNDNSDSNLDTKKSTKESVFSDVDDGNVEEDSE